MKGLFNLFARSARELKSVRCIVVTALLIALDLILKMTVSIKLTENLVISFAFIALASVGMLYGPTVACLAGFITDLLGFMIKPSGAFDIRYTLIEALGALLYGIFLYNAQRDKWMLPRIVVAKSVVVIICNLICTTLVSASYYGKGFMALLPARAIKNLAQLPLDIFLLSLFLPLILKAYEIAFRGARKIDEKLVFSDESFANGFMIIVCTLLIFVLCLAIGCQYLKDKLDTLEDTVEAQQEEIDYLYSSLGVEKYVPEEQD